MMGWEDEEEELLFMWEQLERMDLCLEMDKQQNKSLAVRIKEKTSEGDIIVSICCRPPDQDKQVY